MLDQALGLSAQARSLKKAGGNSYAKAIFQSLNIPFAQVQHLNLPQIAAKHEVDRYQQAKNDALNAWQTGDFSTLMKYPGTVPDPLNAGYNITPAALYAQYEKALKAYPGPASVGDRGPVALTRSLARLLAGPGSGPHELAGPIPGGPLDPHGHPERGSLGELVPTQHVALGVLVGPVHDIAGLV